MSSRKKSSKKKTSRSRSSSRKKTSTRKTASRNTKKTKKKASAQREYERIPYSESEDRYIAQLYEQGYEIERIADMASRKFGTDRSRSTVQGRLGRLRRDGYIQSRQRGKKAKKEVLRRSANGQVEYDQRRCLSADLGNRGKVEIQVSGPVVLDSEFMEDLSQSLGKLVSAS